MDKHYILESVKKIHDLSINCMNFKEAQKKCKGKYCEIAKWIDETESEIKNIKSNILEPYKDMFRKDIVGKYLIMPHYNSVYLFHIIDVENLWKSIYYKYDLLLIPIGEYLAITFDNDGIVSRIKYIKKTDEYEPLGSSYLTSHHYYHLIQEGFNGWKETTKEVFDKFVDRYVQKEKNEFDIDDIYDNSNEIKTDNVN